MQQPHRGGETSAMRTPTTRYLPHPTQTMKALVFEGKKSVAMREVPRPMLTDPGDAIIRVTATTVCGSDLHMYHKEFEGLERGDILGHEGMGIVEEVGHEVHDFKVGDRVVISCVIACGQCTYCKNKDYSSCDTTNPSKRMEDLFGHRSAGMYGYSHLLGGYAGSQAEYVRVPIADVNLLKLPAEMDEKKALLLADVACTGWHANELAEVRQGDVVAVWGLGPVGLLSCMWAKYRGASRVIGIDHVEYRLSFARQHLGIEVIDFSKEDVVKRMQTLVPGGPDRCIDAVGFRFPTGILHRVERALNLETDSPQILNEAIMVCRKAGNVGVIGDYYAHANHFFIGALMEKGLTMRGGQVTPQRYWHDLLAIMQRGEVDPSFIYTHQMSINDLPTAYDMFDTYADNVIKILIKPGDMPITHIAPREGIQVVRRPTGTTGIAAPTGTTGMKGMTGMPGMTGTMGTTGMPGMMGTTGMMGTMGTTGMPGMMGTTGMPGMMGTTGMAGSSGMPGMMGTTGMPSMMGTTGSGTMPPTGPTERSSRP